MSNNELVKSHKRLIVESYTGLIKDTVLYFDEYDGEIIAILSPEREFTIEKHYYKDMFMGWNIKADGVLLETKSTKTKALKFLKNIENRKGHFK